MCLTDHKDWKAKVCDLEHKVDGLATHPEHWHVTALRKAIEDLRAWVVAERRSDKTWQMEKCDDRHKVVTDEVIPGPADDTGGDIEDLASDAQGIVPSVQEDAEDLSMPDDGGSLDSVSVNTESSAQDAELDLALKLEVLQ